MWDLPQSGEMGGEAVPKPELSWAEAMSVASLEGDGRVQGRVLDTAFLVQGEVRSIVSFSSEGWLYEWNPSSRELRRIGEVQGGPFVAAKMNLDRGVLVAAARGTMKVWSLPSLVEQASLVGRIEAHVKSLDVSPDGKSVVVGAGDSKVYRWNFQNPHHASSPHRGQFDLERYIVHATVVESVQYHPQGRVFVSGDWNGSAYIWRAYDEDLYHGAYDENIFGTGFFSERSVTRRIPRRGDRIEQMLFSPSGEDLFIATNEGTIEAWFIRGLRPGAKQSAHKGLIREMAIDRAGETLASYGRDGKLKIWKLHDVFDEMQEERSLEFELFRLSDSILGSHFNFLSSKELVYLRNDGAFEVVSIEDLQVPTEEQLQAHADGADESFGGLTHEEEEELAELPFDESLQEEAL